MHAQGVKWSVCVFVVISVKSTEALSAICTSRHFSEWPVVSRCYKKKWEVFVSKCLTRATNVTKLIVFLNGHAYRPHLVMPPWIYAGFTAHAWIGKGRQFRNGWELCCACFATSAVCTGYVLLRACLFWRWNQDCHNVPSHTIVIIIQVAEHICLIILDELLFQQFLEIAITGGVHKTAEALADSILTGKSMHIYNNWQN